MKLLTTFPNREAHERTVALLDDLLLPYEVIDAAPAFSHVGVGALILEEEVRSALLGSGRYELSDCGWVECDKPLPAVPETPAISAKCCPTSTRSFFKALLCPACRC